MHIQNIVSRPAGALHVSQCPLCAQESCPHECVGASSSSFLLIFSLVVDRYLHQTDGWSLAFYDVNSNDGSHGDGACGCHENCHLASAKNASCVLVKSGH